MIEVRNFIGGLDMDSSLYDVPKGWYLSALNITKNAVAANNDFAVTNIVGNRIATYTLPAGTNKCIGAYPFELRGTVIYFVYNSNGNHSILEFTLSSRTTVKIFISKTDSGGTDILNFTADNKITGIDTYPRDEGDLLFFLDSLGRPSGLDITAFKAGAYTPVTRSILDKIKIPPLSPPLAIYGNDTTRRVNNFRKKLFRFKYRWVYDDFETSVFSPISSVPLPVSILSDVYTNVITNNNVVTMTVNTGDKSVKDIEIAMSFVEDSNSWSDFQSVIVLNKATQGYADNADISYSFYNDSTFPVIDINESIQIFDYVPTYAKAQAMPNGNVLAYAAITEGLSRMLVPNVVNTISTVAAGGGGTVGNLDASLVYNEDHGTFWTMTYVFTGVPAPGTIVTVEVQRSSDSTIIAASTYTTIAGDTPNSVVGHLITNESAPNLSMAYYLSAGLFISMETNTYEQLPSGFYSRIVIVPPSTAASTNSIASWKWSTERQIGLVYFNSQGKTNGVLYNAKVTFPAYAESGGSVLIPYINSKIYHLPPSWAASFQWVFTKENAQYLFVYTSGVNASESANLYFNVTGLLVTNAEKNPTTAKVISWTFQDGDRMRLIRRTSDGNVYPDTYDAAIEGIIVNPTINGIAQTGRYVKIKTVAPFTSALGTSQNYIIELYRPVQAEANKENLVYYELGRQYPTILDSAGILVHGGEVTAQSTVGNIPAEFNFYEGDAYFRVRSVSPTLVGYINYSVMDRNFVDFYISAVSSIDGRPSIIDINATEKYYSTLIRFGQAYQPNTNINGLGRFYPNNFDEYDYNFGDVTRLKVRDRYLKVFQKFKIGVVPLYGQITKDASGNETLVVTDKLLNPIQYRIGNFGLTAPESLASWHFADYGCDTNKGVVWRDSNDGVMPISELYKINSWATVELPLRTGNSKIYGTIEPKSNRGQYIFALEAATGSAAQTMVFAEQSNTFESPLSYHPEMMCTLGTMLVTFLNGALYTHDGSVYNRFYGVDYPSYIKAVFNQNPLLKKSFEALTENSNSIWNCPEITTQVMSYGTTPQSSSLIDADFENVEGQYNAAFLRDSNSQGNNPLIEGNWLKGKYVVIKFYVATATNLITLENCSLRYIESPLNTK